MPHSLKISLLQTNLFWGNKDLNYKQFESLFKQLDEKSDLIVLPELFNTGFNMDVENLFEFHGGFFYTWMHEWAVRLDACLCGSVIVKENDRYYNRFYAISPKGELARYDKRHLFRMGDEHQYFVQGTVRSVFEYKGWKIAPFICYDLRFPVWIRNTQNYDLAIFCANWPESRRDAWITLLKARAIENLTYVAGVNRVGVDGNGVAHAGDSMVIGPEGSTLGQLQAHEEGIISVALDQGILHEYRNRFPAWQDADSFNLT